jgi:hypothetical protein
MDLGHREYTGTMMKRMARYPKEDGMPEEAPMPNVVHGGYRMRDREQYAGREESKMLMARDGAMIHEDWNQAALLPSRVIDRDWPRAHNYHMGMVESLFTAANHQLEDDYEDLGRELKPGKY